MLLSKSDLLGYDRHSETERVWVFYDGLSNPKRLKIQSTLVRNLQDISDEMNLHALQTHESRADALELMSVAKNIITPQANKPVMGIVQDSLLSSYMMTQPGVYLDKAEMSNIIIHMEGNLGVKTLVALKFVLHYLHGEIKILFYPQIILGPLIFYQMVF